MTDEPPMRPWQWIVAALVVLWTCLILPLFLVFVLAGGSPII